VGEIRQHFQAKETFRFGTQFPKLFGANIIAFWVFENWNNSLRGVVVPPFVSLPAHLASESASSQIVEPKHRVQKLQNSVHQIANSLHMQAYSEGLPGSVIE